MKIIKLIVPVTTKPNHLLELGRIKVDNSLPPICIDTIKEHIQVTYDILSSGQDSNNHHIIFSHKKLDINRAVEDLVGTTTFIYHLVGKVDTDIRIEISSREWSEISVKYLAKINDMIDDGTLSLESSY